MTGEASRSAGAGSGKTDTPEAIMEATERALCEHGYADLTMQDIADESDRSKAALHYHYDTKEALLLAFLDHLYESFTDEYATAEGDDAVERLVAFVDDVLCHGGPAEDERFQTALLEIRAQAPYREAYREKLARFDAFLRERVREIVADGIDEGTIRPDVDPDDTASFVATLVDGVNARRIAVGDADGGTRRTFLAYVRERLVAPGADVQLGGGSDGRATVDDGSTTGDGPTPGEPDAAREDGDG